MTDRPFELLHAIAGPDAAFRQGQLEAIDAVVTERRRVLLVQRTGWGKSAVYFIATRLLRDAGAGPTILEGSGVIYVLTIADTTRVASFLRTQGIDAHAYSGETESERRLELEDALIGNDVKVLVATSALGMRFDKPDLGFVIH